MASSNPEKINQAIRECFEHCCQSSSIVTGIATFIANLRASGEWQAEEIQAIEVSVRHLFSGIVDGTTYSGDAKNAPGSDVGPPDWKPSKVNGV